MTHQALVVASVTAGYVEGMPIVKSVSLIVNPAEIVCVVGPNGAGKSTLLKAIAGLLPISSGTISLGDKHISGIAAHALSRSGIAFVPQLDNIFRTMSIEQNLALAARRCKANRRDRTHAMIELFPVLKEKYKEKAGSLSGGQRQFLALAMALIAEPGLLLLDEPSAGLSPKASEEVLSVLSGIAQTGVGILMVEQKVNAALRLSNRAYVLADGQNQLEGIAKEVLEDPMLGQIFLGARRGETHAAESV